MSFVLYCQPRAYAAGTVTNCTSIDLLTALSGGGLVTFACSGTINLTNSLTITNDTVLDGNSHAVIISGLGGINAVRVFNVNTGVNFTIANLTLANGKSTNGGAIFNNGGSVVATDCIFAGNTAIGIDGFAGADGKSHPDAGANGVHGGAGGVGLGGAIYNLGEISLSRCSFQTNSATGGDGGSGGNGGDGGSQGGDGANGGDGGNGFGGAIYSVGGVFATNCSFANNSAVGGNGGAGGSGGSGTFPGFNGSGGAGASAAGAGLYSLGPSTILSSTFSDNSARGGNSATAGQANNGNGLDGQRGGESLGGGICNLGNGAITNCTFYANQATGGDGGDGGDGGVGGDGGNGGPASGGGFYNAGFALANYCTFSSGSALGGAKGLAGSGTFSGSDGSNGAKRGGNVARNSGSFTLKNTIIANSVSGNNGFGTFVDAGHNLSSDNSISLAAAGSLKNTDAKLGVLTDLGGFTRIVPLLTLSPAIDAADASDCPAVDQRDKPRPIGINCDIGAYEFEPTFSVQGRLTEGTNGVGGVTVATGTFSGVSDTNGNYLISNLISNSYTVTPDPVGTGFTPSNQVVTLGPSVSNINFVLNRVQITAIASTTYGQFKLSFLGGPSRTYLIQASTNLLSWQTISTNISQTNGGFQFNDVVATNFPRRFYRTATP
ncbi:MAG: hypothetical protein HY298_14710 [Verrucomicrobia bacterium]|nr:hypothetical protein [Verrucomicrobiota bacterium]